MTRIAYLDLAHGASGDMLMAALAHAGRRLGTDVETVISDAVASLEPPCAVSFVDDERSGIACLRADVKTDERTFRPDELAAAIGNARVPDGVRAHALRGLDLLLRAEAAVHGRELDDVHLHELGSSDTAADLVGVAAGLGALRAEILFAAPVPVSRGWIAAAHGKLPAPAPVTLEILAGARVRGVDDDGELVTPTAAAVLVSHDARFDALPAMELLATGVGAGTRITDVPNICRVLVGTTDATSPASRIDTAVLLETNIDDQSPQGIARAAEVALAEGALDAWVTPVVMKKSRAAFVVSVLVRPADERRIVHSLFRETTTIGIRRRETTRWVLDREELHVEVDGQPVRVKVARLDGDVVNVAPEFDDCVAAAGLSGTTAEEVRERAGEAARRVLTSLD